MKKHLLRYYFIVICLFIPVTNAADIDLKSLSISIHNTLKENFFAPEVLERHASHVNTSLTNQPNSNINNFIKQFNDYWLKGPISHVALAKTGRSAEQIYQYVEHMNVGAGASSLSYIDHTPVLAVSTMMGRDNERLVEQYLLKVIKAQEPILILDLRGNKGGAFVSKVLLAHFFEQPTLIGGFVSRKWFETSRDYPNTDEINKAPAITGNSLISFWEQIEHNPISKLVVTPANHIYRGKTYVLFDKNTESAAELTIAALSKLNNVILIGEKTAGKMLSQKMFDVAEGIQLSLPVATYLSSKHGLIEGNGIKPYITSGSESALNVALKEIEVNTAMNFVH